MDPNLMAALGGVVTTVGGVVIALYTVVSKSRRAASGDYARTVGMLSRLRIWVNKQGEWHEVPEQLRDAIDKELDE